MLLWGSGEERRRLKGQGTSRRGVSPSLGFECGVGASRICSQSVSLGRSSVRSWGPSAVPRRPASAVGGIQGLRVGTGDSGEGPAGCSTQGPLT